MRGWKKGLGMLAVLGMVVTATACGDNNNGNSESSSGNSNVESSQEQVKLRITWWGSQARHDATLKAVELYEEQNPNVTLETEFNGWEGYWDKLTTQAAAKNAPDIVQMDAGYLADWAGRGQLADVSEGINVSSVDQALLDTGKYEGTQRAIPLGNNAYGMALNKEAFEKLGVAAPDSSWTWDDYVALGEEVKAKLGADQYVYMDGTKDINTYSAYQLAHGKGPYIKDGKMNIDKDLWLKYINQFKDMREKGIVPPAELSVTDKELDPQNDLMVTGKTLFKPLHAAQSVALDSLKPGAFDMITMPSAEEGGSWLKASMYWSVSEDSKNKEEAKKFIDWFINNEEAGKILGTSRGVPVSSDVVSKLESQFTEADQMGIELISDTAPKAQQYVNVPQGWSNFFNKDYDLIGEQIMFDQLTPEQGWEELVNLGKQYE
ncbi:ABC transporter substrate-binding protein [Marinicrinis sediminis]|uniref:ABC transporter substrate-binding protein n=1 Tax=Marinicrinis sediminis TaxID=1652465 RepID=A0ABW5RF15_9BACL